MVVSDEWDCLSELDATQVCTTPQLQCELDGYQYVLWIHSWPPHTGVTRVSESSWLLRHYKEQCFLRNLQSSFINQFRQYNPTSLETKRPHAWSRFYSCPWRWGLTETLPLYALSIGVRGHSLSSSRWPWMCERQCTNPWPVASGIPVGPREQRLRKTHTNPFLLLRERTKAGRRVLFSRIGGWSKK